MQPDPRIAGLILAGGRSSRMGQPKALVPLLGQPMVQYVFARARAQVGDIAISSGVPVLEGEVHLADPLPGFAGPLAGILAGLDWAATLRPQAGWLATFSCDTPVLPLDLVQRLAERVALGAADIAVASSAGRTHPVCALWPLSVRTALRDALLQGQGAVWKFQSAYRVAVVDFAATPVDPFLNVNAPEDVAPAEAILNALSSGCAVPAPWRDRHAA